MSQSEIDEIMNSKGSNTINTKEVSEGTAPSMKPKNTYEKGSVQFADIDSTARQVSTLKKYGLLPKDYQTDLMNRILHGDVTNQELTEVKKGINELLSEYKGVKVKDLDDPAIKKIVDDTRNIYKQYGHVFKNDIKDVPNLSVMQAVQHRKHLDDIISSLASKNATEDQIKSFNKIKGALYYNNKEAYSAVTNWQKTHDIENLSQLDINEMRGRMIDYLPKRESEEGKKLISYDQYKAKQNKVQDFGADFMDNAISSHKISKEDIDIESDKYLYHGTSRDLNTFIDKDGNIILKPSSNFDGKQIGVSLTPSSYTAEDYAKRIKGTPMSIASNETNAKIIRIDKDALKI
jgi:hypothetical protein